MYPRLIIRNVLRNIQTYSIYFFSLTLIYSLLYAFNALPNHPVMTSLSGSKKMLTTIMTQYMGIVSYMVVGAVIFLIVYSTNFVLKRRQKELGLYATLGMKKCHIMGVVFCETLFINLLALVVGFLFGLMILIPVSSLASDFFMGNYFGRKFFWDNYSVELLVVCYLVTSLIIGALDVLSFRKQKIISLIQDNEKKRTIISKAHGKWQIFLFTISTILFCVICFYLSNYSHLRFLKNHALAFIVLFLIVVILFYTSLSQFILRLIRATPKLYFQRYNSFKVRQFSKQADNNSIVIAVLSLFMTLTLTLLIFSGSTYTSMKKDIETYTPYDMEVSLYRGEDFHYLNMTTKDCLKADGFNFNVVDTEYQYTIHKADSTYKDIIDTNHLWPHDKYLPDTPLKVISLSSYNHLMKIQGKEGIALKNDEYAVNQHYKGTEKQIKDFLKKGETLTIGGYSLKSFSKTPLENVYFLSSVGTNDFGTFIVPDKVAKELSVDSMAYVATYKEKTDMRQVESFLKSWLERHYFKTSEGESNDFTYQTKLGLSELSISSMGVIVFVMIFVAIVFTVISFSILSLQALTNSLDSAGDYKILYLLGNRYGSNKKLLFQQILLYFLTPFILAIPLSIAFGNSLLGYFTNFANTDVVVDLRYLGLTVVLFIVYLILTHRICSRIIQNN